MDMKFADKHSLVWQLSGKQTAGENTAGLCRCKHGPLVTLQCTCRLHSAHAAASLSLLQSAIIQGPLTFAVMIT